VLHRHKLKKDESSLVLYFRAVRFHGEPASLEPKKFTHVEWISPFILPENVSEATSHVLSCVRRGEIYSEFPSQSKALAFWQQLGNRLGAFPE
jgi:hypothetical protein